MGCLFMLSDYVVYGGYRLWLDNDRMFGWTRLVFSPKLYVNDYAIFISIYLYINISYYINILFYLL